MDVAGIIRLKVEVLETADVGDFGIPAFLPARHPMVENVVLRAHEKAWHVLVLKSLVSEVVDPQRQEEHSSHSLKMFCVQNLRNKTHRNPTAHAEATCQGCCCVGNNGR